MRDSTGCGSSARRSPLGFGDQPDLVFVERKMTAVVRVKTDPGWEFSALVRKYLMPLLWMPDAVESRHSWLDPARPLGPLILPSPDAVENCPGEVHFCRSSDESNPPGDEADVRPTTQKNVAPPCGPYVDVKVAAGILGCSPGTVYKLFRAGVIQGHRVGLGRGRCVLSRASVDAYKQCHAVGQAPVPTQALREDEATKTPPKTPTKPGAARKTKAPPASGAGPGLQHLHLP